MHVFFRPENAGNDPEIYMTKDSDYTRSRAKAMRWNHEVAFVWTSSFFIHYAAMDPQERLGPERLENVMALLDAHMAAAVG
jgi:hypothetical protein